MTADHAARIRTEAARHYRELMLIADEMDRPESGMCPYCGAGGQYWDGTNCYYGPHDDGTPELVLLVSD